MLIPKGPNEISNSQLQVVLKWPFQSHILMDLNNSGCNRCWYGVVRLDWKIAKWWQLPNCKDAGGKSNWMLRTIMYWTNKPTSLLTLVMDWPCRVPAFLWQLYKCCGSNEYSQTLQCIDCQVALKLAAEIRTHDSNKRKGRKKTDADQM